MSEITTAGLNLLKNVFQVHKADGSGRAILRFYETQALHTSLSTRQFCAIPRSQHSFHIFQAVHCGAHLRLIEHSLGIRDHAPEIHRHLALFFGDNGLNDGRGLLWDDTALH
jgi:hypothetical protein